MKLEVAVADVSQAKKDLTIEVPVDEVKAEYEKTYDAFSRHVKVPGFRPGRVPRGVVKQRFSKDVKEEVIGRLLPHALQHAIVDNKLRVVGEPVINEVSVSENEPLKFKASVEVLPDFELVEYKGLKATRRISRVTDEDVERVIERWRESSAEFVPVEDRASQPGDFVSVNLVGKYVNPEDSPEGEDLKAEDVEIELGAEGIQPEFNEHLLGVKAEDVREFRVTYPEDFGAKGLAGKTIDFTATVVAVRTKEIPQADDDFAKDTGEFESIEQMREKVREDLEKEAGRTADEGLRKDLIEQIVSSYDFEIPASLVEQQAAERTREFAYMLMRSGMSNQQMRSVNWEERMESARIHASRDVRTALIVGRIGEAESVNVTDDELDAEIGLMAASTGESPAQLKARLTKDDALSSIENRLRYKKALDVVVSSAEITTEELAVEANQAASEEANKEANKDADKNAEAAAPPEPEKETQAAE